MGFLRARAEATAETVAALALMLKLRLSRPIPPSDDFLRYGFDELDSETIQSIFNEHTRLEERGFTEVRRGFFVRHVNEDIAHVLRHYRAKSTTQIQWGLSLSFVPHNWRHQGRFHRTMKAARLDLFDWVWDDEGDIARIYGVTPFKRDLQKAWEASEPRATRHWETGSSLAGVLELAVEQIARKPSKFGLTIDNTCFPGPRFVRAFTLARLGRLDEARAGLEDWKTLWRHHESTDGADRALERAAARS